MTDPTPAELMDRAARDAEADPAFIAWSVAVYRETFDLSYAEVAAHLGIDRDALSALMLCRQPRPERFEADLADIAWKFRADAETLRQVATLGE